MSYELRKRLHGGRQWIPYWEFGVPFALHLLQHAILLIKVVVVGHIPAG